MARDFNGTSSYLYLDSAPASFPVSIAAWSYPHNDTGVLTHAAFCKQGTDTDYCLVDWTGNQTNDPLRAINSEHSVGNRATTIPSVQTLNTWQHVGARFPGGTDYPVLFHNGDDTGASNSGTGNVTADWDRTVIGALFYTNFINKFDGGLAEVALWDVILGHKEFRMLADGYSPLFVRPGNLIAYVPLIDSNVDLIGNTWTNVGAQTWMRHPDIIYPSAAQVAYTAAAAPAGGLSVHLANQGGLAGYGGLAGKRGGLAA